MSGVEVTEYIRDVYINEPVDTWHDLMGATDVPEIRIGMCGLVGTALTLTMEEENMDILVDWMMEHFGG